MPLNIRVFDCSALVFFFTHVLLKEYFINLSLDEALLINTINKFDE